MNIRTTLYSIALFFAAASGQLLVAQEMPKIMSPSPEAASVFKFGEIPVSLYTGVPNITVPIYEIEARGLTIPINLSYHARGIQVSEIASQVGLGWSLNYGGMISRQIRGGADEGGSSAPYLSNNASTLSFFTTESTRLSTYQSYQLDYSYDFTPDQFHFTANNLSGKFILDKRDNGKPVIQQFSDAKIHTLSNPPASARGYKGFTITDGYGNKYYFGVSKDLLRHAADYESVQVNILQPQQGPPLQTNPNNVDFYTTWHLMDIETAQGEMVHFFYEKLGDEGHTDAVLYRRSFDKYNEDTNMQECQFSRINSMQCRISEIHFEKGRLKFEKSAEERKDLQYGHSLGKIRLFDPTGLVEIKSFEMQYDYIKSDDDANQLGALKTLDTHANWRMFLKSVQTKFPSNDTLPRYKFKYNATKLPFRHSNSQDIWGYYNGKPNGHFLKFFDAVPGSRAVDSLKVSAGLLTEISNPQGGVTRFQYEQNRVINTFPKTIVHQSPVNFTEAGAVLSNLEYYPCYVNGKYTKTFTVGGTKTAYGKSKVYIDYDQGCGTTANTFECKFIVSISGNGFTTQLFKGEKPLYLAPGSYTLTVQPQNHVHDHLNPEHYFRVYLDWAEEESNPYDLVPAAGKRVKKIEYFERKSDVVPKLSKSYKYIDPQTGISSGMLFGLPGFYATRMFNHSIPSLGVSFPVSYPLGSVPGSPLSTYQGNSVGYGVVTEYYGEGNTTVGKTEYRFSMIPDTGIYYDFPYHPPTDNEWLRGKEKSVTHFKRLATGTYIPVRKIENEYLFGGFIDPLEGKSTEAVFTPIPIWKPLADNMEVLTLQYLKNEKVFRLPIITFCPQRDPYDPFIPNYKTYHFTGGTVDIRNTKVTDYFDDGTEMMTRTDYTYDYIEHYNQATAKQTQSDGTIRDTKYFYAGDYEMALAVKPSLLALKTKNMLSMPLVTESYQDDQKLSEVETQYKDWGNDLLAPEIIKTSKGTVASEIRIKYNAVDTTTGNPLEVEQAGGIKISYIWGHNKTLPLAKIENMAYASIPASRITAIVDASNATPYSEANLLTALNNLRTDAALANAIVTTYTYKPLIGIASITDPKGDKITYHYDNFHRLEFVKDKDGKILSENQYHYRPQN